MKLRPLDIISGLSKQEFTAQYVTTKQPVVLTDFVSGPALSTWNYDYFKQVAGTHQVEIHGGEKQNKNRLSSAPIGKMAFGDYLDEIQKGPSEKRLFLFNLLLEQPEIRKQLHFNKIVDNLVTWLPLMFFGAEGSSTRYHYDIDMSHVFLTQFEGLKKVYLFPPEQSDLLYRLPYNFHGIADLKALDYDKFPALKHLNGWECTIGFGQTVFMPAGYWHFIQYETSGYSVSVRAVSSSFKDKVEGFRNLVLIRHFDNAMRTLFKNKWYEYKCSKAYQNAARSLSNC